MADCSDETIVVPGGGKIHPASLTEPIDAHARELRAPHDKARRIASDAFPESKAHRDTSVVVDDAEDANGGVSAPADVVVAEEEADLGVDEAVSEAAAADDAEADAARANRVLENVEAMSKPQLAVLLEQMNVRFKSKDSKSELIRLAVAALTPTEEAVEGE